MKALKITIQKTENLGGSEDVTYVKEKIEPFTSESDKQYILDVYIDRIDVKEVEIDYTAYLGGFPCIVKEAA